MPDTNGLDLMKQVRQINSEIPFIVITGVGSEKIASEFIRLNAFDYILKDVSLIENFARSLNKFVNDFIVRKQIELQNKIIAEKDEKYQLIYNNIRDVYIMIDKRMKILEISPSIYDLLDISACMLINQPIYYLLPSKKNWKEAYRKLSSDGFLHNFEIDIFNKSKNIFRICSIYAKLTNYQNQIVAIVTMRDITDVKKLQKKVEEISTLAEEKERTKISENLHDFIGPLLSTTMLYLNKALIKEENEEIKNNIQKATKLLSNAINNIRNISNNLMSMLLNEFGLEKSIKRYVQQYNLLKNLSIILNFNLHQERFNSVIENIVYRCVLELMNNSVKHSNCNNISLKIESNNSNLIIVFTDNGIGFDFNEDTFFLNVKGQGLFLLVYRIKSIGGNIYFKRLEKGIKFTIEIPINENLV